MPSRRTFLKATSLACAASAMHPMLHAQNGGTPDPFSNQNLEPGQQGLLTLSAFKAVLQSIFTLFLTDGTTRTLRLVDASSPASGGSEQVFTLSFTVAGGAFPQGTYTVDHATMGSFALFVVPSSTDSRAQSCTAVFNNLSSQFAALSGGTHGVAILPPVTATAPTTVSSTFRPASVAASVSAATTPVTSNNTGNAAPIQTGPTEVVMVEGAPTDFNSNMDVLSDSGTTATDANSCTDSKAKTTDSSAAASSSNTSSSNTSSTASTVASSTASTSCAATTTTSTTTQQQ